MELVDSPVDIASSPCFVLFAPTQAADVLNALLCLASFRVPSRYACFQEFPSDMRPQAGDVLAFKILSLNEETWTPELSAYQEATVSLECRGWQYLRFVCLGRLCCSVNIMMQRRYCREATEYGHICEAWLNTLS